MRGAPNPERTQVNRCEFGRPDLRCATYELVWYGHTEHSPRLRQWPLSIRTQVAYGYVENSILLQLSAYHFACLSGKLPERLVDG